MRRRSSSARRTSRRAHIRFLAGPARRRDRARRPRGPAPPRRPRPRQATRWTIVVDPGHGGTETGAIGSGGLQEKDATLQIARRLAAALPRLLSCRAVLTRDSDSLISLDDRTSVANHEKADLFLSIHANSSRATGAQGSETYYLSLEASDKLAQEVAAAENQRGRPPRGARDARNPALDFILWDLAQSAHLKESSELAEAIQKELNAVSGHANRGIKQAPFRVLVGATMPAVLVESRSSRIPRRRRSSAPRTSSRLGRGGLPRHRGFLLPAAARRASDADSRARRPDSMTARAAAILLLAAGGRRRGPRPRQSRAICRGFARRRRGVPARHAGRDDRRHGTPGPVQTPAETVRMTLFFPDQDDEAPARRSGTSRSPPAARPSCRRSSASSRRDRAARPDRAPAGEDPAPQRVPLPEGEAVLDLAVDAGLTFGSDEELTIVAALVDTTLQNVADTTRVRILVNGEPAETLGARRPDAPLLFLRGIEAAGGPAAGRNAATPTTVPMAVATTPTQRRTHESAA